MKGRAYAIDLLRGLAIVGMVLSGNFGWNPALPAWLFHAQVPPPDFTFDPSLPGITWVDLVFPFFLFSMGAAFPFSLGRKLDRGVRPAAIVGGILRRGVLLAFFAVALGNLSMWRLNEVLPQPALRALLTLAVWGGYFALFIRLPALSKRRNDLLNACGAVWLVAMMLLYRRLGVPVSVERSDIIILVLANVVVAGSFVWWATRRRPLARLGVVALLVALKIGASVPGSWNETLWNASFAPWLYRAEFMKYLCIVLPGSIAGDLVARWLARRPEAGERPANPVRTYLAAGLVLLAVPVNMWGLFTRHLTANLLLTVALGGAAWLLLRRPRTETEGAARASRLDRILLASAGAGVRGVRRRHQEGPRHDQLLLRDRRAGFVRGDGGHRLVRVPASAGRVARALRPESDGGLRGGGLRDRSAADAPRLRRSAALAVGRQRLCDESLPGRAHHGADGAPHGRILETRMVLADLTPGTGSCGKRPDPDSFGARPFVSPGLKMPAAGAVISRFRPAPA